MPIIFLVLYFFFYLHANGFGYSAHVIVLTFCVEACSNCWLFWMCDNELLSVETANELQVIVGFFACLFCLVFSVSFFTQQ